MCVEGELVDLVDEFSDGRVQFAFAKLKDPNTTLPKSVLIGWCGEGVPERTKGYFTSHLAAVSKVLHVSSSQNTEISHDTKTNTLQGYHVQVTARSDRDLTPESIVQKVSDASGSKYSGDRSVPSAASPLPPSSSKPAFTPTRSSGAGTAFNPIAGSRIRSSANKDVPVDEDGWGNDAPPVTRTQLEKVQSSYQPTKVNMRELSSQKPETSRFASSASADSATERSDVVKGAYQPVGKVDIAALRRQAQEKPDDRPTPVKGSYEPVGKVDIAAIRARARQPSEGPASPPKSISPVGTGTSNRSVDYAEGQRPLPDRSGPATTSERLTSLPKPKVANRFGSSAGSFTGTKAPTPSVLGMESKVAPTAPPVGVGRAFADQGGKTPAQLWAEKKAREQGSGVGSNNQAGPVNSTPPITNQNSGDRKSGYGGKSWAPVQTTRTGQSAGSLEQQRTGLEGSNHEEVQPSPVGGIEAMRDRFKDAPPMGAVNVRSGNSAPSPPPLDTSNKPNAGHGMSIPGLPSQVSRDQANEQGVTRMPTPPAQPPRSPTPPTPPALDSGSPIRIAMPVGRGHNDQEVEDARDEQFSPPPSMPTRSLAQAVPHEQDLTEEPLGHDPARGAGEATAATTFGEQAAESVHPGVHESGKRALVQYDYEKAEDNELELKEGEYVTNIEMVDDDWWMGQNSRGESGLFPSNYVELVQDDGEGERQVSNPAAPPHEPEHASAASIDQGATATALYDYEAAEGNELSFSENATITGIVRSLHQFLACFAY